MFTYINNLGKFGVNTTAQLGRAGVFLVQVLSHIPRTKEDWVLLIRQIYFEGVLSLSIIMVSALFIGMVVALQGFNTLEKFGAEEELGKLLALSVVRELGPVVAALLFAGRAGSALTAEIALMKTTEQLASMEMMGVDPLYRVIWPRLIAGFISLPLLAIIFDAVAILGGTMVGVCWLNIDAGSFWSGMQATVDFSIDVLSGIKKALVFGFMVAWIAVFQGYDCEPTAAGMAKATTKTVVYASLTVLGLDFILTSMMVGGW